MPQLTHPNHLSVQTIFSPDKVNVMAVFPSAECKLFHIPSLPAALVTSCTGTSHETYENKSRNYCIVGLQISRA